MEQVPDRKPYGIIGAGRAATHLSKYLELSRIPFITWSRKASSEAVEYALQKCETILLLISDDSILGFLQAHPSLRNHRLAHFSGARSFDGVIGLHPLASFSTRLFSLAEYQSIPFVTEKGEPGFSEVFPDLPNPHRAISKSAKARYHALCVLAGNFSSLLWEKYFTEMENLGIEPDLASGYLRNIFENIKANPLDSLTGPLPRNDQNTLKNNLASLEGDPYQSVYRSFMRAFYETH